jgi:signal transduction histidine kinase
MIVRQKIPQINDTGIDSLDEIKLRFSENLEKISYLIGTNVYILDRKQDREIK